jgi:hypothetical protein
MEAHSKLQLYGVLQLTFGFGNTIANLINHVTMYLKHLMCQDLDTLDTFISFLPIDRSGL